MILENNFWIFPNAIPSRVCDQIIRFGNKAKQQPGIVGRYGKNRDLNQKPLTEEEIADLKKKDRDSNISWLDANWLFKWITPYIKTANRNAGWNFQFNCSEDLQFTRYNEGQYYRWHADSWNKPYDQPNNFKHGKIRKLSCTCSLNDGSEYEGGDLEFWISNVDKPFLEKSDLLRNKGSLIVFPSHIYHRVTKVTKGTRYSLVSWHIGDPWK
jgi:PKHD-type hydroxylase